MQRFGYDYLRGREQNMMGRWNHAGERGWRKDIGITIEKNS